MLNPARPDILDGRGSSVGTTNGVPSARTISVFLVVERDRDILNRHPIGHPRITGLKAIGCAWNARGIKPMYFPVLFTIGYAEQITNAALQLKIFLLINRVKSLGLVLAGNSGHHAQTKI